MNLYKFYEELLRRIREKQSTVSQRLLNGSFDKLEDYKHMVGKLKMAEEIEALTVELFKGFEGQ